MLLHIRRSCLFLAVLSALIKAIQSNENETDTNEARQGRVRGRSVKLYSGVKPDPIVCFEEGFKADPGDCSTFYRCVPSTRGKYNLFKFQCGPGTVYDPESEICNHPSNTKRSECNTAIVPHNSELNENGIELQELPSPIITTSPFYLNTKLNASGAPVGIPEKDVNRRNSTTNLHVWTTTTTANQLFSEAFGISGLYSWDDKNSMSNQVPPFSTKPPRTEKSDPCVTSGFVGDSYDCKKFYRCVDNFRGGFTRYEFVCSDTTIWDDEKQSCNYAWSVRNRRCGRDANDEKHLNFLFPTPSNSLNQNQFEKTNNYNDITVSPHYENENILSNELSIGNHFGEKLNNSYNSQENPIRNNVELNKQPASSNNNDANMPYQEQNITTDKNLVAIQLTEKQYSTTTESQILDVENKTDFTMSPFTSTKYISLNSNINDSMKLLNNLCTRSGFVGNPNDCRKFYRCVDNGQGSFTRYEFSCSQGTLWDSQIEACNHAWAVKDCGNTASVHGLTTEHNDIISSVNNNESEDMNYPDNNDYDYGYPNRIIQDHTNTTTPKIETTFSLPTTAEDTNRIKECSSSGFFGNSGDCSKFYRCVENGRGSFTRFEYSCGEGTLWDDSIEACNHAWAVTSCKSNSESLNEPGIMTTITLVQTTTQENINSNNDDAMYGSQQDTTTSNAVTEYSSTTLKQTFNTNKSECTMNGFMGDKEDCKKFYRCVENGHKGFTRYEFSCGDGTVWDSAIEACNYDWDVKDCGGSSSSNNEGNNVEPIDNVEEIESGYATPSNKDPDNFTQITVVHSTPSNAPNKNNMCETLGFMGDADDCNKFYRCVDNGKGGFDRIEFKCAEGTVWDSSIEACNHRWAVEKCGKYSNNEFSETTSHSIVTTNNEISPASTKSPEYLDTSTQLTSTQQTNESEDMCVSEGFYGSRGDCKKFYRCVDNGEGGYTKYEFYCGDGTFWDKDIQACNHATNNMTCRNEISSSSTNPQIDSSTSIHAMESTTPTSTTNIDTPPNTLGEECTSEGFIANPSDCSKFSRCVDNGKGGYTKFEFSCGEGTVWIQEILACDHDTETVSCHTQENTTLKSSTIADVETTTSSTHVITDDVGTSSTTTHSANEDNSNNNNENENCSSEGFYPNKYDCKRFYRCVDDGKGGYTKYDFSCAEGTAWNTQTQSCNYIAEVSSCKINKPPEMEIEPDSNNETSPETQQNTTTTTPQPKTTTLALPNESICNEQGFFGDRMDCKKFYRCVSNENGGFTKYEFTCGDGTIWDQDITSCNHPEDVSSPSCKPDGTDSSISSTSRTTTVTEDADNSPTTTKTSITTSTESYLTTTKRDTTAGNNANNTSAATTTSKPSTTSSTANYLTTTMKNTNSNCSNSNTDNGNNKNYTCTKAGFYADPNDCKKFYRCVDWENNDKKFSIYHFECGDGTIWDPALETCNYEESIYPPRYCNGSEQQKQNNSESASTTEKLTTKSSETESTGTVQESKPTTTTTPQTITQSTTTKLSTTESQSPTTTTEKSTIQTSTTQSITTTTQMSTTQSSTLTTSSSSQTSIDQISSTTTSITTDSSTQQTSTTTSEASTTDSSSQTTTDVTESTISEATTSNLDETTAMTAQISSTTEQSSTTEITTSKDNISSQTTESQSSTTDFTTTTNSQDSSTEANSSANKGCPDTEDGQYLYVCPTSFKRHPKYCNMFYQCTEDNESHEVKVAVFNCPNNTIYDESKVQCVEEEKASKKCDGHISQRNRIKRLGANFNELVIVSGDSMKCSEGGHFPFEKRDLCSPALLKCEYAKSGQLRGYVYKCPEGFVYWAISRRCEAIRKVKDCKRSTYSWNKRHDIPVERHNIGH